MGLWAWLLVAQFWFFQRFEREEARGEDVDALLPGLEMEGR